jgi:signal transduction histidine kinase
MRTAVAAAKPEEPPRDHEAPARRSREATIRKALQHFHIASALMSVIPLLICCYLIIGKLFSIQVLEGANGVWFLAAVLCALIGLLIGRRLIRHVIQQLVQVNTTLQHYSAKQEEFVNHVSHEFRSPLAIIKGAIDNLADGMYGPLDSDQVEPITISRREIDRLKRLVGDLLDVAQIESGKFRLVKQPLVLQDLLRSVANAYKGIAAERRLALTVELQESPAPFVGDPHRLSQVFVNLLANALKFTQQGGVTLRLSRNGSGYQIEVADTGRGIAKEDLARIFERFERVGVQTQEGSGLGLPIAKTIIEMHQGRILVESQPERGSRFIVTLPAP